LIKHENYNDLLSLYTQVTYGMDCDVGHSPSMWSTLSPSTVFQTISQSGSHQSRPYWNHKLYLFQQM